eukprot:TRINITY_DN3950_c0_g1_i1.p1 TRINITY_DN3950_c0_g1~~TRINITY_DN3950_c0_g1_i1.p1  ORF type:complete len:297 (-),score=64.89 TRINITY_DN3950_c0_g1_i1:52-942(-)
MKSLPRLKQLSKKNRKLLKHSDITDSVKYLNSTENQNGLVWRTMFKYQHWITPSFRSDIFSPVSFPGAGYSSTFCVPSQNDFQTLVSMMKGHTLFPMKMSFTSILNHLRVCEGIDSNFDEKHKTGGIIVMEDGMTTSEALKDVYGIIKGVVAEDFVINIMNNTEMELVDFQFEVENHGSIALKLPKLLYRDVDLRTIDVFYIVEGYDIVVSLGQDLFSLDNGSFDERQISSFSDILDRSIFEGMIIVLNYELDENGKPIKIIPEMSKYLRESIKNAHELVENEISKYQEHESNMKK